MSRNPRLTGPDLIAALGKCGFRLRHEVRRSTVVELAAVLQRR